MTIFSLKILAVITMVIDHIGFFYRDTPIYFRWIGRLSAPIFMFCSIEAFLHTRNKKKYFKRLYILNIIMGLVTVFLNGKEFNFIRVLINLIFIIFLIETYKEDPLKSKKYIKRYIIYQIFSLVVILVFNSYVESLSNVVHIKPSGSNSEIMDAASNIKYLLLSSLLNLLPSVLGSIFFIWEGLPIILIGISMYVFKDNRLKLFISYLIIELLNTYTMSNAILTSISIRLNILGTNITKNIYDALIIYIGYDPYLPKLNIFTQCFQWMSIFSLIFIFLYNGKRGKSNKYFFYIIYPLHIIILAIITKVNIFARYFAR